MTTGGAPTPTGGEGVDELSFRSGDVLVPALLHRSARGDARELVVALTGLPGAAVQLPSPLADALTPQGIDVLRFNYRGTWGNAGAFDVTHSIADLRAAIDFATGADARERFGLRPSRIHVVGHSYGATIGLLGAMADERVAGVAAMAPVDFSIEALEYVDPAFDAHAWLEAAARNGREWGFTDQDPAIYLEDLIAHRERHAFVPRAAALLDRRLLFVLALDDASCPPEVHCLPLYRALRALEHPRLEAEVLTTDHVFTDMWPRIFAQVAAWVVAGRASDPPDGR